MQTEKGLENVQNTGHLGEDEHAMTACISPSEEDMQLL
jgi:hypothetical protein